MSQKRVLPEPEEPITQALRCRGEAGGHDEYHQHGFCFPRPWAGPGGLAGRERALGVHHHIGGMGLE